MKIERSETDRGFRIDEFIDANGVRCTLQMSSAIHHEALIWLGCCEIGLKRFEPYKGWTDVALEQNAPHGVSHIANTRMHLSQSQVAALIPRLSHFVETGEIATAPTCAVGHDMRAALKLAIEHIQHMAAFIGTQKLGYSFESLGEDMPGIRAAVAATAVNDQGPNRETLEKSCINDPDNDPKNENIATAAPSGIELAARFVDRRRDDYVREHGSYDPSTGMTEYPGNGDEYVYELEEIAEGIRALSTTNIALVKRSCGTCLYRTYRNHEMPCNRCDGPGRPRWEPHEPGIRIVSLGSITTDASGGRNDD